MRFSVDYIKNYIEKHSNLDELLSKKYINNSSKLELRCGNIFKTSFAEFKDMHKHTCNECSNRLLSERQKFTYEYVFLII